MCTVTNKKTLRFTLCWWLLFLLCYLYCDFFFCISFLHGTYNKRNLVNCVHWLENAKPLKTKKNLVVNVVIPFVYYFCSRKNSLRNHFLIKTIQFLNGTLFPKINHNFYQIEVKNTISMKKILNLAIKTGWENKWPYIMWFS